ncbi:MAG: hypothetical protein HQK54_13450, partial [Oligoflexales bacterium]|nr:hypothetical protein [Oligoflexales bacterium]
MMFHFELSAVLAKSPFPDRPHLSNLPPLDLKTETDFDATQNQSREHNLAPILVSYRDYYEILVEVVNKVREDIREVKSIIISINLPTSGKIPLRLLEPDVLLCQDGKDEIEYLKSRGGCFFSIDGSLRRSDMETGSNEISLRLYNFPHENCRFNELARLLKAFHF